MNFQNISGSLFLLSQKSPFATILNPELYLFHFVISSFILMICGFKDHIIPGISIFYSILRKKNCDICCDSSPCEIGKDWARNAFPLNASRRYLINWRPLVTVEFERLVGQRQFIKYSLWYLLFECSCRVTSTSAFASNIFIRQFTFALSSH